MMYYSGCLVGWLFFIHEKKYVLCGTQTHLQWHCISVGIVCIEQRVETEDIVLLRS